MYTEKSYHITISKETVLPVTHIESYKNIAFKNLIHSYKFAKRFNKEYIDSKHILSRYVEDICFDTTTRFQPIFYTCPPSTMYAKKEKQEDSMRELFRGVVDRYTHIFNIQTRYLHETKAQHLHGQRKHRISNLNTRYSITTMFKIRMWYIYTILKKQKFSFCIIDDISSTGGTLQACRDTLDTYMRQVQQKYPDIFWDIQVFSIGH